MVDSKKREIHLSDVIALFRRHKKILLILVTVSIMALGLKLRMQMVAETVIDTPLRADATQYYAYAYNLRYQGVYSNQWPGIKAKGGPSPRPDSFREPGYALFLAPFVVYKPTFQMLKQITYSQALLSTFTILLSLLLFHSFLSWPLTFLASLLVTISPHLITTDIYVLSESLFTFSLVLFAVAMRFLLSKQTWGWALGTGLLLGITMLIRPTMMLFTPLLLPAFYLFFPRRNVMRLLVMLLLGFTCTYGPWVARNILTPDMVVTESNAAGSLHNGMYPGLMYKDIPQSKGMPHRFDPNYKQLSNLHSVLNEIIRRFKTEPLRYTEWYLWGKPRMFLSWDMVAGQGDVFVYPVITSPFHISALFQTVHRWMKWLHSPLMCLSLLASLFVWLPWARRLLSPSELLISRFCSLLIWYFVGLHTVVTPLPRYSVPLRPFLYGMACFSIQLAMRSGEKLLRNRLDDSDQIDHP